VIKKQFGEKGQVLSEELVVFTVYLPYSIPAMLVHFGARRCCAMDTGPSVFRKCNVIAGVSEAPATDIEAVCIFDDQILGVN
jgi:hypothetical protein